MALKGQLKKIIFCKNIIIFLRDIGFKLKLEFANFIWFLVSIDIDPNSIVVNRTLLVRFIAKEKTLYNT